jgi:hypothetical protein
MAALPATGRSATDHPRRGSRPKLWPSATSATVSSSFIAMRKNVSRMSLPVHAAGALISVSGEGVAHCPRRVENVFESRPDVPLHLGMRVWFKGA